MFVLTIDQRDSTHTSDLVPDLLAALEPLPAALPAERTAGDEVQVLYSSADTALLAVQTALRTGRFAVGLGIGEVERPLPDSTRAARGPAYLAAREAVERAKRRTSAPCALVLAPESAENDGGLPDADPVDYDALLWPWALLIARRTEKQWEALDALSQHETQRETAAFLGKSDQALSRLLQSAHAQEAEACLLSLSTLLGRVDPDSRSN